MALRDYLLLLYCRRLLRLFALRFCRLCVQTPLVLGLWMCCKTYPQLNPMDSDSDPNPLDPNPYLHPITPSCLRLPSMTSILTYILKQVACQTPSSAKDTALNRQILHTTLINAEKDSLSGVEVNPKTPKPQTLSPTLRP